MAETYTRVFDPEPVHREITRVIHTFNNGLKEPMSMVGVYFIFIMIGIPSAILYELGGNLVICVALISFFYLVSANQNVKDQTPSNILDCPEDVLIGRFFKNLQKLDPSVLQRTDEPNIFTTLLEKYQDVFDCRIQTLDGTASNYFNDVEKLHQAMKRGMVLELIAEAHARTLQKIATTSYSS